MKLERSEVMASEFKNKKQAELERRRVERQGQLERVTNRRRNQDHQGQIKQLEEKLRTTVISQMKKVMPGG
jgi:predicted lipase